MNIRLLQSNSSYIRISYVSRKPKQILPYIQTLKINITHYKLSRIYGKTLFQLELLLLFETLNISANYIYNPPSETLFKLE